MHFDPLPSECLVDQTLEIRVRYAHPGELVVLRLCSRFNEEVLLSEATFRADTFGVIDLCRDAPTEGSYAGTDAMGLFWSRSPVSAEIESSIELPSHDPLTSVLIAQSADGRRSASHVIRRVYAGPAVSSRKVTENGLVGKMFEPLSVGPCPALLVVGGSGGGLAWSQEMAALLASHGFAALALAYFAADGLPSTLDRIPLEYFGTALEWIAAQPGVAVGRIGVVGVSRGGELALLLGATFPRIRAVVGYVPSGILWPAYPASGYGAWTVEGHDIPFATTLTYEEWDRALADGRAREDSFDWYLLPLKDPEYVEKAAIPVERINGPVLMISGADDKLWPSKELTDFAVRRLREKKFPHRFEHLCYESAGHSIAWPNGPTTMLRSVNPVSGEKMDMGGTPEGNARARTDSWPRMLEFLRSALAEVVAT
jgi:dienelactone hydrolase